jgi:DNA invertase Pin-like site-specific DNA recombinase
MMVAVAMQDRPPAEASGKVQEEHRDRLAVVYVRQSTLRQLRCNTESAKMQYALAERAAALGWPPSRVLVIDEDTGHSAAGVQERPGFARLVSEVSLGHVGMVLGIEMSRLARSGRDWHQLLELCALSRALLADPDGVYDPAEHNDRLLLGLKGTISEAELYLIKQRMWGGRLAKARRGELSVDPPLGYWRRPSGEVALDPDEQVRAVVDLVFTKYEELGTVHAVLRWMVAHGIELGGRERCGPERGEVVWRRPNRTILRNMIRSPVYAGIYTFGRKHSQCTAHGIRTTEVKAPEDWLVYLPGRLPAYITEGQWRRNRARLQANRQSAATPGAPRQGPALLTGLLVCARCGTHMNVRYRTEPHGESHTYLCNWEEAHYGGRMCQQLVGACLDACVTEQLLTALAPASLELSLAAAEQVESDRAAVEGIWRQRLERADYEIDRARRCYHLAEPENRLVVRQLEADWEQALAARERLLREHARQLAAAPRVLTAAEREAIRSLADDLPGLWHAPSTTMAERKQLIRLLIEHIAVRVVGDSEIVEATITWAGGRTSTVRPRRPVAKVEQLSYYPQMIARIRELSASGLGPRQIAETINAEGYRTAKRNGPFSPAGMHRLLRRQGLLQYPGRTGWAEATDQLGAHEWFLPQLAAELDMPQVTLHGWIGRGWVSGRQDRTGRLWILHADPGELAALRERRARPNGYYTRQQYLANQEPVLAPLEGEDHATSEK